MAERIERVHSGLRGVSRGAAVVVVMAAVVVWAGGAMGADWPNWLGPNRDGTTDAAGESNWVAKWGADGPKVAWEAEIGLGFSSVAVAEGRAYAMGNLNYIETVYCFDAASGEVLWEQSYEGALINNLHEGGPTATPTVYEGRVYTVGKEGQVHCLDAESGEVVWTGNLREAAGHKEPAKWGYSSSGVVLDGKIVFQVGPMVALDLETGELVWRSKDHPPAYSTPTLFEWNGRPTFAAMNTWGLSIVDGATGQEWAGYEWETNWDTSSTSPIVKGELVFISTGYHKGCAVLRLSDAGLSVVYRKEEPGDSISNNTNNSVVVGDYLYGFDGEVDKPGRAELVCMRFGTGEEMWRQDGLGCGSLLVSDGKLLILSDKGLLVTAVATETGYKELDRAQVVAGKTWTMPTMAEGRVYVRTAKGKLVCLDLRGSG